MAIDILQRYYTTELLWMKYIGTSSIPSVCLNAELILHSSHPSRAAPLYAALTIYLTWQDHGSPNLRDIL